MPDFLTGETHGRPVNFRLPCVYRCNAVSRIALGGRSTVFFLPEQSVAQSYDQLVPSVHIRISSVAIPCRFLETVEVVVDYSTVYMDAILNSSRSVQRPFFY